MAPLPWRKWKLSYMGISRGASEGKPGYERNINEKFVFPDGKLAAEALLERILGFRFQAS
jgi:hypothetical protein